MRLSGTRLILMTILSSTVLGLSCLNPGPQQFGKSVDWEPRTVNNAVNVRPTVVEVSDFDGDGKLDIVVGYEGEGATLPAVYVFFQQDVDTFIPIQIGSHADLAGITGLAVGDIDADSHNDVVAACNGRLMYLNSPDDPRLPAGWTLNTIDNSADAGTGQWSDVAIGDIDSANGPDLVASNKTDNKLSWFPNPGNAANGAGWTRTDIDAATRAGASAVALDDIDGDGDLDVFSTASSQDPDYVAWYENPNDPAVDNWTQHAVGKLSGAERIAVGDVDNDGDKDLVVTSPLLVEGTKRIIGWYQHPAAPKSDKWNGYELTRYTNANLGPPTPTDVKLTDVDGDGQLDAIVAAQSAGTLRWFVPVGSQINPWGENNIHDLTGSPGRVATGDINGDGRPDLVVPLRGATPAEDSVAWFENPEE